MPELKTLEQYQAEAQVRWKAICEARKSSGIVCPMCGKEMEVKAFRIETNPPEKLLVCPECEYSEFVLDV